MSGKARILDGDPRFWALSIIFAVLAVVATTGAAIGSWSHNVLLDTETWVETVGPIGTDERVREAVADAISTEMNAVLRPVDRLQNLLPDLLDPLGVVFGERIEGIVEEEVTAFIFSERYETVWLAINENAHRAVVSFIRDDLPFLSTSEGVVSIDLRPFLDPILDRVIVRIRQIGDWIPDLILNVAEFDDAIAALIADYEEIGLPESLGQVVVFESSTLGTIQDTVELFDRLVFVLPVVAALFAVVAIWVAPSKAEMVVLLSAGGILAWLGTMLATDQVTASVVEALATSTAREVASVLLPTATQALYDLLRILIMIAALTGALGLATLFVARQSNEETTSS